MLCRNVARLGPDGQPQKAAGNLTTGSLCPSFERRWPITVTHTSVQQQTPASNRSRTSLIARNYASQARGLSRPLEQAVLLNFCYEVAKVVSGAQTI